MHNKAPTCVKRSPKKPKTKTVQNVVSTHCPQRQEARLNLRTNLLAKRSSLSNDVQDHVADELAADNDGLQTIRLSRETTDADTSWWPAGSYHHGRVAVIVVRAVWRFCNWSQHSKRDWQTKSMHNESPFSWCCSDNQVHKFNILTEQLQIIRNRTQKWTVDKCTYN